MQQRQYHFTKVNLTSQIIKSLTSSMFGMAEKTLHTDAWQQEGQITPTEFY